MKNEILQQRIEEAARIEREQCREDNNEIWRGNPTYNDVEASFIKGATFALQNQWISVEEALPPSDDRLKSISIDVMVKNEYGKVTSAWYDYERKEWHLCYGEIAGDDLIDSKITHWMPIPQIEGGEK